MKRFLSMFMSIVMLLSITVGINFTAYAETISGSCGDNVTYIFDTDTGLLTISGTGPMSDYISLEDYRSSIKTIEIESGVTSIGYRTFYNCDSLINVTVGSSVTSIGDCAFDDCDSLTTVTISNSVTSIGDYSFRNCYSLTNITIPNSVTSIGYRTFYNCDSLINVTVGSSVTSIGGSAFGDCNSLISITVDSENKYYSSQDGVLFNKDKTKLIQYPIGNTRASYAIPNSVTSIGHSAFYDCNSLTNVTIPNSVTSIGDSAFNSFTGLTSIEIPNSVTSIGDSAFSYCTGLTNVTIPNSVTSIGNNAFFDCDGLTSITIPSSVKSIGNRAFKNCDSLTSIEIPNSVTRIGDDAFSDCFSLTNVTIGYSVTSIGHRAFASCVSLTNITIPNSVTRIGDYVFSNCDSLTNVTIGNSVTRISNGAFNDCDSLTSITIPNNVINIGGHAFDHCDSLTNVTIGNSVTSIVSDAFAFCKNLTSITIPNSVTSIGDYAFYYCDSLTNVTIGNSVTSIGKSAFYSCSNLTNVTIGNSVTSIGDYAFYGCDSLTDVYYSGTVDDWNKIIIGSGNYYLLNATIHYNSTIPETIKSQSFKVKSDTYEGKYGFYYTDDYFSNPSTKYNQSLATMSLCLALSTYQDEKKGISCENVNDVFSKCGFDVDSTFEQKNYDIKTGTDTIGCSFVNKKIGDETLIAVAVRSGGYGAEWASNVTLGLSGDHQGFDEASNLVYSYLADYIKTRNITGKVKFWITGFSRGGAAANLLAAKLDNTVDSHPNISYDKEDVYAYTFATPAGANKSNNPHSSKYNNIFNIIHYHDIVPLVAPSQFGWGFDRYGITKVFSFYENSINTNPYEKHMKEYLKGMGCEYKVNNFKSYVSIAGEPVVDSYNYDSLGMFNRKFVRSLTTQIGTRHTYTINYQNQLRNFFSENIVGYGKFAYTEFTFRNLCNLLMGEAMFHPHLTTTALKNYDLMAIAHMEDANYLAWMMSMDKNYDENNQVFFSNGDYRVVKVNCPVDVYVYDSSDNLVASIINEVPQDIEGSSIISSIDENEQKLVYLPIDSDYRVEVVAREDCQTTYTVNEYSGINADISKVVSYSEVDMQENESMISEIDAYSQDEIDSQEGATDGSTAEYTLELNNNLLSPNVKATGKDVENYTYNVQVSYDENQGEILGGGQFTAGDFCLLTATNKAGYMFEGWYVDNSKVSSEYSYRFAVKGDCTVEARFVPCTHQSYTENVVPPTYEQQGYTEYTCTVCGYTYTGNYVDKLVTPTPGPSTGGGGSIGGGGGGGFVPPTPEEPATEPTTQPSTKPTVPTTTTAQSSIKKPKSTSIKKLTKGTKSFKVTWKKKTGVSGYQVQYATDKKFKKNKKTVTIAKKNATSKTIKKLKSKKTYYVRVRTYKIVNGKKVYSSWSKVKAVKTK